MLKSYAINSIIFNLTFRTGCPNTFLLVRAWRVPHYFMKVSKWPDVLKFTRVKQKFFMRGLSQVLWCSTSRMMRQHLMQKRKK